MGGRPGPVALWLDHRVSELESMSRVELIKVVRYQDIRIAEQTETVARQSAQITALSTQLAYLMDRFEEVSAKLARVEHLLSRNTDNSNFPSSKDGGIGGSPPSRKERRTAGRTKGKQKGAPGSALRLAGGPMRMRSGSPKVSARAAGISPMLKTSVWWTAISSTRFRWSA